MTDQYNIDRSAVFGSLNLASSAAEVYQEILFYERDTGIVPTRDKLESSYPSVPIPWDTEITADEVIAEARRSIRTVRTTMLLSDIHQYLNTRETGNRMIEVDDIPDLVKLTETYLQHLQATGPVNLPFRLLSLADIDTLPDPESLIEDLIDHGTVTKLVGESGKGNSFVAIDWALCIATGRRWQGAGPGRAGCSTSPLRAAWG